MPDNRIRLSGAADKLLNRIHSLFGHDRELDQLSAQVTDLKKKAFSDGKLSSNEISSLQAKMAEVEKAYAKYAANRGFPVGETRPTTPQSFKAYQEQQEIHFEYLSGKDLRGGVLGELKGAIASKDAAKIDKLASGIAHDIVMSSNMAIARDKIGLLRATLSHVDDRSAQLQTLALVRNKVGADLELQWPMNAGKPPAISLAEFDKAATFNTAVSVHKTELPAEVKGTDKLFPNKPLKGWEETVRAATKASMDDLAANGQLFLSRIPPGSGTATVAVKLDLNLGADGPPSVSDPAATNATLSELLERAKKDGKSIRLVVGDSSGGENIFLGRTSMDIMRDTGNYHHTLKAGLRFAAQEGDSAAAAALAKIEAAEARGVFFGSKNDKVSTPADLAAAEKAASKYVECVDYDKAGFARVDPELGPVGLATWGTREFQIAKPWVEADYRVHVARGASTHILAGWTGSVKGLIGLHAFGLRPADQGMDKRGENPVDGFRLLTQATGFGAVLAQRTGMKDVLAKIAASDDPALKKAFASAEAKWSELRGDKKAWESFSKETNKLAEELKEDQKNGMGQPEVMEKMRLRTRAALERADAIAPGFKQTMWDAAHEMTRFAMVAGRHFRALIPNEIRDANVGNRIGLLAQLPYQSDLIIKSQPKMGEGGGPDAYAHVKDVGVIIAGTDTAATDVAAWKAAGKNENVWKENYPLHGALIFGRGPMHMDEITGL